MKIPPKPNSTNPETSCCLCGYKGSSEMDLETHIDNEHANIFKQSNEQSADAAKLRVEKSKTPKSKIVFSVEAAATAATAATNNNSRKRNVVEEEKEQGAEEGGEEEECNPEPVRRSKRLLRDNLNSNEEDLAPATEEAATEKVVAAAGNKTKKKKKNKNIDYKFLCPHCTKPYALSFYLNKHVEDIHKGKSANVVQKKPDLFYNRVDENTRGIEFLQKLISVQTKVKEDASFDMGRQYWLRLRGFKHKTFPVDPAELAGMSSQVQISVTYQLLLEKMLPGRDIQVEKSQQHDRKNDVYDVCFSPDSRVHEIFVALSRHCEEHNDKLPTPNSRDRMEVSKLVLPATKVRMAILEAIGNKVCSGDDSKSHDVILNLCRPNLRIFTQDDSETAHNPVHVDYYEFHEAVDTFRNVNRNDFSEAHQKFRQLGFKDADRPNFVVDLS